MKSLKPEKIKAFNRIDLRASGLLKCFPKTDLHGYFGGLRK